MRKPSRFFSLAVKLTRQRGQAMTEFTIAAACVLVPLFLMLPYLGKYMDMKATSIQAARYAAWERTVWYGSDQWESGQKTDAQISNEVLQRFFNDTADAVLTSTDQDAPAGSPKSLWSDHNGETFLGSTNATTADSATPGTINTYVAAPFRTAVNALGTILDTKFKLDTSSLYTSTVTLTAVKTDAMDRAWNGEVLPGGNAGLTAPSFTEKNVLVANGWSANGPAFVKKQTEGLAIFNVFNRSPVSDILGYIQDLAGIYAEELGRDSLKIGVDIKPDLVPPDRLSVAAVTPVAATPAKPPRKSPQQEAADRDAAAKASAAPIEAKAKALHQGIENTQASINSCKAAKNTEYQNNACVWASYSPANTDNSDFTVVKDSGFILVSGSRPKTFQCGAPRVPPGGPNTSWTPIFDADVACQAGLDQQIADLQAKLNDPDLQKAKTESDTALRKNPELANDTVFMNNRVEAYKVIQNYQDQIDNLIRQKNAIPTQGIYGV